MTELGLGLGQVRQWHIDALARRAALHQGAVRQVLEEKLQRLRSAQQTQGLALVSAPVSAPGSAPGSALEPAQALAVAPAVAPEVAFAPASTPAHALPAPQPLADLLAHIAHQTQPLQPAQPTSATTRAASGARIVAAPMELKAIRNYRGTWSRLRAERRLHQALALVPHNAGPLNTQRLLHQALHVMQQASAGYLLHFMAHVEGLLALDLVNQPLHKLPTAKGAESRPKRGG